MIIIENYTVIKIRCQQTAVDNRASSDWLEVDIQLPTEDGGSYHTVLLQKGMKPSVKFKRKSINCTLNNHELRKSLFSNFKINLNEYL